MRGMRSMVGGAMALAACVVAGGAMAAGTGPSVSSAGFCAAVAKGECTKPIADGQSVSIASLPKVDGKPALYFFSVMTLSDNTAIIHAWSESGGKAKPGARIYASGADAGKLKSTLSGLSGKVTLKSGPATFLVGMMAAKASTHYHAYSQRDVLGPGTVSAEVVGADGTPIAGGAEHSITVTAP